MLFNQIYAIFYQYSLQNNNFYNSNKKQSIGQSNSEKKRLKENLKRKLMLSKKQDLLGKGISKPHFQKDGKDSIKDQKGDPIQQSFLGKQSLQLNKKLSSIANQFLEYIQDMNNQKRLSRHGFIQSARQLLKQNKNSVRDFFLSINQFYNVIKQHEDNELEVEFPSYDLKFWQPAFRQTLINSINNNLANEKAVVGISLDQVFLNFKTKEFVIKKGINLMKPFDVSSTLLQNVQSLALKLKDKEQLKLDQKINNIFKEFNEQKTEDLLEKYSQKYQKYLKSIEEEKKQNKSCNAQLINNIVYKINKTIFKETNAQNLALIRRQNQLKMLNVKFHCIMIRCYYLQASYRRRDLALKPHYAFKNEYQKIIPDKNKEKNEKAKQSQEKKRKLSDLDEQERLIFEIGEMKKIMKDYQDDIVSISHVNKSMDQFQKLIKQQILDTSSKNKQQLFKIQSKIQQTLANLESIIVTEIYLIDNSALIPRKYRQSIQFFFNKEDLLIFIQIIDSLVVELNEEKIYKDEIPKFIKTKIPQIKLLLSYPNQTSFILNKIIDDYHQYFQDSFIKRQMAQISEQNMWKKQWQEIWQKKTYNILNHMALFNYVAISYQFSKQEPFHLNYFCIKEQIKKPILYNLILKKHTKLISKIAEHAENKITKMSSIDSKTLKKLQFFWKTYQRPQNLMRMYEYSSLSSKEIKEAPKVRRLNFQELFNQYASINQIRQHKIRYLIHFSQFFLEIIWDLSYGYNSSLEAIFNTCRFLILNFICFFYIQSVKRIEKEIKDKHGEPYYQIVKNEMNINKRILENHQKVADALRLSGEKIKRYITQARTQPTPSTNARKLDKIFSQFKSIKKLFEKLNCQQPINNKVKLKKPEDAFKIQYDFDIARQSYMAVVRLMTKDYLNKDVLSRIFKKITQIAQDQVNLVKSKAAQSSLMKYCAEFQSTFKKTGKFQLFLENKKYDALQSYQLYFQKFALSFFQMAKLSSMILSMPFYSYENQVEYMRKRRLVKDDLKKFEKQKGKLLYSLDVFYIYQRQRINAEFMGKNMKNFQFINIFGIYMKNVNEFFRFMRLETKVQKLKFVKKQQSINVEAIVFRHPKYLHNDIISIYSKLELEEFFFSFNQKTQEKSPFKLEPDLKKQLEYFFELCDKMEKRAIDIKMEIKRQIDKKGNFGKMNQVKEEIYEQQCDDQEDQEESVNQKQNKQIIMRYPYSKNSSNKFQINNQK